MSLNGWVGIRCRVSETLHRDSSKEVILTLMIKMSIRG